jgi:hypothetical protein
LDVKAFEEAWQMVTDHYGALRSSFYWDGLRQPVQIVHRDIKAVFELKDWRGLTAAEIQDRLTGYVRELRQKGFDMTQPPHEKRALLQVGEDSYWFVWSFNYMLHEGWSYSLLWKDFFACYEAICSGRVINFTAPRPYGDYIDWIQSQDFDRAEQYWRGLLKGYEPQPGLAEQLHMDGPVEGSGYVKRKWVLPVAATTALRSMARRHQLTLNTVTQSAWAVLLSRYTQSGEVGFGCISSGRPAELVGVEAMVGALNNFLPMRVQVDPNVLLVPWLKDFQAQQAESRQYEYCSPEQIQGWSDVALNKALYDSYITFENYPADAAVLERASGWATRAIDAITQTEHAIRIEIWPVPLIGIYICYYQRWFRAATIEQIFQDYQGVLEAMAANPSQRLGDLLTIPKLRQETARRN